MRIVSRRVLREFWKGHGDAEGPLRAWVNEAKAAAWETPMDIRRHYRSASFLAAGRVVFNVKGNAYRLVVAVRYDLGIVFVRFIGTHAEYDGIDAATI